MTCQIRLATTADAALVADLSRQTFWETFAAQNTAEDMALFLNKQFTREALIAEVGAAGHIFLLAYAGEEPVGYAGLRDDGSSRLEVARIYVTKGQIGQGIGKTLMQACIDQAQAQKKNAIWLGVWEKNERAIQFYTAWGFEKVGTHAFRLGNDVQCDWIMQKSL